MGPKAWGIALTIISIAVILFALGVFFMEERIRREHPDHVSPLPTIRD
jgi:hypothetical protein